MATSHSFQHLGPQRWHLCSGDEGHAWRKENTSAQSLLPQEQGCLHPPTFQLVVSLTICRLATCFPHSDPVDFGETCLWRETTVAVRGLCPEPGCWKEELPKVHSGPRFLSYCFCKQQRNGMPLTGSSFGSLPDTNGKTAWKKEA